jgi:hypothetical protein
LPSFNGGAIFNPDFSNENLGFNISLDNKKFMSIVIVILDIKSGGFYDE